MPLTNAEVKKAKPKDKLYKIYDERGLYLEISPAGGKWWRLKYMFKGKEKRFSLGVYPDVSLQWARDRREGARKLVAQGIDPLEQKKAEKITQSIESSFESVALEWLSKKTTIWSKGHAEKVRHQLESDIFPHIGSQSIADISGPNLLAVIRKIEERGALDTAHRALQNCGQIFGYAIASGLTQKDPSTSLKEALLPLQKEKHFAAITDPEQIAQMLQKIDNYQGSLVVQSALKLAPLVFVRPGELRVAQWKDIELSTAEWRYRVVKTDVDHIVPLSRQAVGILRKLQAQTGFGLYVFPGARNETQPMSEKAVLSALQRMGIEMTGHGFRAMARTVLDEVLGIRPDFIEHQLAHMVRDPNGRAYNRTAHLAGRKEMMQKWADYLDNLKRGVSP